MMDQFWQVVVAVSVVLATIVSVISSLAKISATFGSLRNWIFNRHKIKEELAHEAATRNKQLDDLTKGMKEVNKKVDNLQERQETGMKEAEEVDKLLLRGRLIDMTDRILRRGYEYPYEVDDLNELLDKYEAKKGNGGIKSRVERARHLDIKYGTEPWENYKEKGEE